MQVLVSISCCRLDNLKALMSLGLFSELPAPLVARLEKSWTHSRTTAAFAHAIAKSEGLSEDRTQDCFTAGLLHDIGQIVLASLCSDEYYQVVRAAQAQGISLAASEYRAFGSTHAQVGGYLLGLWGLPDAIVEAVAWHHEPSQARPKAFTPLIAVHVADFYDRQMHTGTPRLSDHPIDEPLLAALGLQDRLPDWEKTCQKLMLRTNNHD